MSEEKGGQQLAHKVVLSTGREVLLREMKIKHQVLASKAIGNRAGDNQLLMATLMQCELLKLLIIEVDGKAPSSTEREDLDSLFSYPEFQQLQKVVGHLMGGDAGEFRTEIATTGKQ